MAGFSPDFRLTILNRHHNQPPGKQTQKKNLSSNKTMQTTKSANHLRSIVLASLGLLSTILPLRQAALAEESDQLEAVNQSAPVQGGQAPVVATPTVFQAAGPNASSIQSTVDAFRAALGDPVNGNNPGPLLVGRREINWDGGNPAIVTTTAPVTPFNVFQNTRGALFTTPGSGLSQATPAGLAVLFNNPTYANIFATFSPSRLFTPVGSKVTNGSFSVPGSAGLTPAAVSGFGVVFTDVDQQRSGLQIEYFDVRKKLIFESSVPASPGNGSFSFVGIKFADARIASIRITTEHAPGPNDDKDHDIVMMDDFIYGEPQAVR